MTTRGAVIIACLALALAASRTVAAASAAAPSPTPASSASPAPSSAAPGGTAAQAYASDIAAAIALRKQGKMREALALLAADYKTAPSDRALALAYAQTFSLAGDQGQAISIIDALLATYPDDIDARVVLARAYAFNHDFAAAEDQYQRCLATAPQDADAQVGLAQTYAYEGRLADAKALYAAVLAADPRNYDALVGLAAAEGFSGDYKQARSDYQTVLAAQPDNMDALVGLATVEYWLNDLPSATVLDDRALNIDPADGDAQVLRRQLNIKLSPQIITTMTTSHSTDGSTSDYRLAERFFASPALAVSVMEELYRLSGGAANVSVQTHRFGIGATYRQSGAFGVDLKLLGSKYAGWASATDSVLSVSGVNSGFAYGLGVSTGGVEGSVAANGGQTSPGVASAVVRINSAFGNLGYTRRKTTGDIAWQTSNYNDGNHYHGVTFDVSHEFALAGRAWIAPVLTLRTAGFSNTYNTYAQALAPGYYDFQSQRDVTLGATAWRLTSDRLTVGLTGSIGLRRTTVLVYGSCVYPPCPPPYAQSSGTDPFQRLEPFFDYEGDRYSLAAAYYDDHYKGGTPITPFAANTLDVTFSIRLP